MRILTAIPSDARAVYAHAFYKARWVEHVDLTKEEEIEKIVQSVKSPSWDSLQLGSVVDVLSDDSIKQELQVQTQKASSRGVFGVPRFFFLYSLFCPFLIVILASWLMMNYFGD